MTNIPLVDGYAHIGQPRFQTVETALSVMGRFGISSALICPFETCPDLNEVHRGIIEHPDKFVAYGLPLGSSEAEVVTGLHAQIDAGFSGARISTDRILEVPAALETLGQRGAVPLVVGRDALANVAGKLVDFLDAYPESIVVSPHMAGPMRADVLTANSAVRALYSHPSFHVVLSRQTLFDPAIARDWVYGLIETVGPQRLMWGSEVPVLFWRDETPAEAAAWFAQFDLSQADALAFYAGNAQRTLLARPRALPAPLALPYEPFDFEVKAPAPMFPLGFAADNRIPEPLFAKWIAAGGPDASTLADFTSRLLRAALENESMG
ncbi:MAG: amidohydrolase family protein [Rhodobacteraceae bacterium]|nr:amidohydrolase family protein [Paracoccaceae bacterium]PHR54974.1 MAG: hypothetical protein COA47_14650 [Robiginitomaculum sp.]